MWHDAPMLRLDSSHWPDILSDAAVLVVGEHGLSRLKANALARHIKVTPPALVNRFGSTRRALEVVVTTLAGRWESWIHRREGTDLHDPETALRGQLTRLIPATDQEIQDIRAWSAIRAFALHAGESHPELAGIVRRSDAGERLRVEHCLARYLGEPPPPATVEVLAACVAGLRERVLDPDQPLDPEAAREALALVVDRMLVSS